MNISIIRYILGWILNIEAALMLLPCLTALIYQEKSGIYFVITMVLCGGLGALSTFRKPKNTVFYAKEGMVSVALSWIALSFFGALPFYLSREIPVFEDALFEVISGFTTTGSSILPDVEALSRCMLLWRSFTHWIGGMGIIVFMLAVLPSIGGGATMHIMRAESPGPSVGKLVPKVRGSRWDCRRSNCAEKRHLAAVIKKRERMVLLLMQKSGGTRIGNGDSWSRGVISMQR